MTGVPARIGCAWCALWLLVQPVAVVAGSAAGAADVRHVLRDDWGREVPVAMPTARIVSLAPHATELLHEAGAGAQLIAVDIDSDFPPDVGRLPRIAALPAVDAERLRALEPSFIVAWGAGLDARQLQRLATIAPTFVSEPASLDDIARTLDRFAQVSAQPAAAHAAAARFRAELERLRRTFEARTPVTAFYQIWDRPLMTVSDRGTIGDAMRVCGARNAFGALPQPAAVVDAEAVLAASPRLLVVSQDAATARDRWRRLGLWRDRAEHVAQIDAALLQRPTTRMLAAVAELCRAVETARR